MPRSHRHAFFCFFFLGLASPRCAYLPGRRGAVASPDSRPAVCWRCCTGAGPNGFPARVRVAFSVTGGFHRPAAAAASPSRWWLSPVQALPSPRGAHAVGANHPTSELSTAFWWGRGRRERWCRSRDEVSLPPWWWVDRMGGMGRPWSPPRLLRLHGWLAASRAAVAVARTATAPPLPRHL